MTDHYQFTNPHVCKDCAPYHVDNCPICFGYGFKENGTVISAGAVDQYHANQSLKFFACPRCMGTPFNLHLYDDKCEVCGGDLLSHKDNCPNWVA